MSRNEPRKDRLLNAAEAGEIVHLCAQRFRLAANKSDTLLHGRVRRGKPGSQKPRYYWKESAVYEYLQHDVVVADALIDTEPTP